MTPASAVARRRPSTRRRGVAAVREHVPLPAHVRCRGNRRRRRQRALEAGQVAVDFRHDACGAGGGPAHLHLGRAGAVHRHHRDHRLPWPLARYASRYPSVLRLSALARATVRLSRHLGRHGRPLRHDPPARHPRLGAAQGPATPILRTARRSCATAGGAALRARACAPARAGHRAVRARRRFYQFVERTWMAQQLPWAILFSRSAGCRGWSGASRCGWQHR